ncbi:MAG: trigger factor [Clostridiales bacterium]|nr:trigger factor [Clostridiales bacterium]
MSSKLEKVENNIATLEIDVSSDELEKGILKAYIKNVKKFNIPGFRKGKAPKSLIEKYYGEGVFYEDAINEVCPVAYEKAVDEHKLEPVDTPKIDIIDIESGKGLVFKAEVTVKPEVVLGEYKSIEAEKKEYNVTDEDVLNEIEIMRDKNARIIDITDRPVKSGDKTIIDFKGFVDEKEFEGGAAENHELIIGSGQFIPGFEEQLIGVEIGKEVDIYVNFPDDYRGENLAGKPALFKVTVKEIKEKELLPLDDEFAKDVSEFETLDELKDDIKTKKTEEANLKAKHEYEDLVIKKVVENAEVEIPEIMVENQIDTMLRDFDFQLRYQGLNLETYLKYMNTTMEEIRKTYKDVALNNVKTQLVLEAITKKEEIDVTEEDLNIEIDRIASQYKQEVEKFRSTLKDENIDHIKESLAVQKTMDFLIENSISK